MLPAAAAAAKSLQSCLTLCNPRDGSPPGSPSLGFSRQEHWSGLPFPSPMHESEKWKWSHSVVSDSSDPVDCSLPGSSAHGIFQASKNTGVGSNSLLQGIFLTQGSNPCLLHCKSIFHCLSHQGSLDNCWARSNEYYTVSHSPFLPRLSRSFELILMWIVTEQS